MVDNSHPMDVLFKIVTKFVTHASFEILKHNRTAALSTPKIPNYVAIFSKLVFRLTSLTIM